MFKNWLRLWLASMQTVTKSINALDKKVTRIMTTLATLPAELDAINAQGQKIFAEVTQLKADFAELEAALGGALTVEQQASLDRVKATFQVIDDLNADTPAA